MRILFDLPLLILFIFTSAAAASTIQLPQTGQTQCYDSTGAEINCAGTGQDGEIQAGIVWPSPRFIVTYCNANGPCLDNSSDCDGDVSTDVVVDMLTGFMWTRNGNLPGPVNWNWNEAIDYSNNLTLCGYSDWRLPNRNELHSLIDYSTSNPAVPAGFPFTNIQPSFYWSSTTSAYNTFYAWILGMRSGDVITTYGEKITMGYNIWPVRSEGVGVIQIPKTGQTAIYRTGDDGDLNRGVTWPNPRFTNNGNGTITDNLTGLTWLQDANCIKTNYPSYDNDGSSGDGEVTWQHALDFMAGINNGTYSNCSGGYSDMRLPNINELESLLNDDESSVNVWLNTQGFTNVQSYNYWSSTTLASDVLKAWFYIGGSGSVSWNYYGYLKYNVYFYVWPVRGGHTIYDSDGDGIPDGNGNNPCTGGNTSICDDNCINSPNPNQENADYDGVGDVCDNCAVTTNYGQQDTDSDGYGNACDCDLDNNDFVGPNDYNMFGTAWYSSPTSGNWNPDADFDSDGFIGPNDYTIFGQKWNTSGPWQ